MHKALAYILTSIYIGVPLAIYPLVLNIALYIV